MEWASSALAVASVVLSVGQGKSDMILPITWQGLIYRVRPLLASSTPLVSYNRSCQICRSACVPVWPSLCLCVPVRPGGPVTAAIIREGDNIAVRCGVAYASITASAVWAVPAITVSHVSPCYYRMQSKVPTRLRLIAWSLNMPPMWHSRVRHAPGHQPRSQQGIYWGRIA